MISFVAFRPGRRPAWRNPRMLVRTTSAMVIRSAGCSIAVASSTGSVWSESAVSVWSESAAAGSMVSVRSDPAVSSNEANTSRALQSCMGL